MVDESYDHSKRWWTLVVLCLSLVIVVVGNTVLNVALPTLVRELHASNSALQWVVDAYGLVFAGLLLTAGAIGDRFGRKGTLTAGLLIFGGASTAAAFCHSAGQLTAFRAIMGIGAALIMPATLSILTNVFPPHERAKAIAIWAGLAGAGAAVGPVAGGFLLEHFWYGSVFLVNLPLVAAALIGGRVLVPNSQDPHAEQLDPIGAALSMAGLGGVLYGIIEGLGVLLLAQYDVDTPYWHLVVAIVTMAVGMGLSMAPSTTGIMASLPLRKAGVGSAINDTTRELGGALGVAVLGSLLASKFTAALPATVAGLPASARTAVRSSLGGALGVAGSLPGAAGASLQAAAKHAYVSGMSVSLVGAAVVAIAAAVMVRRFYPDRIVMQDHVAHVPAPPASADAPVEAATGGNGHGPSDGGLRPLEEVG